MSIQEKYIKYKDLLAQYSNNMEKYEYLIELGKKSNINDEYKLDSFLIPGCMSKVWLVPKFENGVINFMCDSDAHITKGLVTIIADIFSGATSKEIQEIDVNTIIEGLQLFTILSLNRRNGTYNMFGVIKKYAETI